MRGAGARGPCGFHAAEGAIGSVSDREDQQHEVQARLADEREPPGDVRVGVAREQRHLEEQQARAPHGRPAAEPRQDEPGRHRLDEEQEERAECDGDVKRQRGSYPT